MLLKVLELTGLRHLQILKLPLRFPYYFLLFYCYENMIYLYALIIVTPYTFINTLLYAILHTKKTS